MHNLKLNAWHANKDMTCFIKPLEELGPDKKALCIFVATSHSHIQIYRTRRDEALIKHTDYTDLSCKDAPISDFTLDLVTKLLAKYQPGERSSFPFKDAKKDKGVMKFFGHVE